MKKLVLLIFVLSIIYSCQNNIEKNLTNYRWEIEKIVDLKTGMINQTELNQDKIWDFNPDKTYTYQNKKDNINNVTKGNWDLDNYKLLIFNEFDSTHLLIENICTENMVWLINENDSLRFYLKSKIKEITVPDFPKAMEQ
jgi:hypothetical protein